MAEVGYEVLNDVVLNPVVFACENEVDTRAALVRIQASGVTWVGPTHWRGRYALRISVSSWATTRDGVDRSLAAIAAARSTPAPAPAPAPGRAER